MDLPRKCCKQKTYGGIGACLSPLAATLTKNRGGCPQSSRLTASSADPYPPALLYPEFLLRRNMPSLRRATSSAPSASATSAETGTGAPFSTAPAAPSPVPGCARLYRHAAKNIPKAAATSEWPSPG